MALIKRISRLFAADMHAIIDQLEEPEAVLRQAVREMAAELDRQVRHARQLESDIAAVDARVEALGTTRRELDAKLDLSFDTGNEDLARRLTRRKLETVRLTERLVARRATLEDGLAQHEALVAANRDELEAMRQKAELLGAASETRGPDDTPAGHAAVDEADVEIAFLREKQARSRS